MQSAAAGQAPALQSLKSNHFLPSLVSSMTFTLLIIFDCKTWPRLVLRHTNGSCRHPSTHVCRSLYSEAVIEALREVRVLRNIHFEVLADTEVQMCGPSVSGVQLVQAGAEHDI